MIEILWKRHYHPEVTGNFHGDMARAFQFMLADPECDDVARRKMGISIRAHIAIEHSQYFPSDERKWFTEAFPREVQEALP